MNIIMFREASYKVRKWIIAVLVIIVVLFAVYMFRDDNNTADLGDVKTAAVKREDLRISVGATGRWQVGL